MALNIRPSSDSSAASSTKSSSKKPSTSDLFAQDMKATAARQSKQPAPAPKPAKPASTPKQKHADDDSQNRRTSSSSNSNSNGAGSKPKAASSASQAAANAQSGQNASPDDAAGSEANAVANGAKGRAPARTAPKTTGSQNVATKNTADPSADTTNPSGLSLLQLLTGSLRDKKLPSDTTATDPATLAATDKTSADGTDNTSDDPNAIALAMVSQALAAAVARQQAPAENVASAGSGDPTSGITSATQSPGDAASMQDLMTVLAHDVAAGAKGKSDDGATQLNVDPAKATANDASSTDPTAVSPNALTHLGGASHFAAQHLRNDTNTGDLKSPVGSSAWQDEVATHLTWMTQKGLETGSLRVSPEHLGPVEVNISVQNGHASVWFAANHPDTRAALEQALPRLREMFANQGMNLADSGVSRQSLSQQGSRNQSRSGGSQGVTGVSAVGAADGSSSACARINLGLVDLYA